MKVEVEAYWSYRVFKFINMLEVKKEFKELIPPLTVEEFKQLEDNCLAEGIRDKIITWNGFIIDGHNRYEIATRWNLDYQTESKSFDDEEQVKDWMDANQLGRRNLTLDQRRILIGRRYNREKNTDRFKGNQYTSGGDQSDHNQKTSERLAKENNTSAPSVRRYGKDAEKFEEIKEKQPELASKIWSGEKTFTEIKKEEKKAELIKKKEQYSERVQNKTDNEFKVDIFNTNEKFRVIYADPAWSYNDKQDTPQLGGAAKHYDTMSISQLCELPVKSISEKDSVLFLWVTSPLLEDAFTVINAWGFKYKTSFIWDKVKHNMGHYNSVRHEILLIATKGSCTPDNKTLYDSVQSIERNDNHSEKPIEFLNIIDDLYNYGDKLEMFCRNIKKANWFGWGNEL
jgi:N6-adenosine-specific RNA methylase IME4